MQLLVDLLQSNHVVDEQAGRIGLSRAFLAALEFRDLLEAKLDFANLVAPDFIERFSLLLSDPARFMSESRLFELFGYHHSLEPSPENYQRTRTWMRFTTCLTRYETQACLRNHDFGRHRTMLDVGGNSGEFVLRICKAHPEIRGTVFDLPLVCDVGQEHVRAEPEAGRIQFVKGNALADPLPTGFDLVTFKSMLHDWPEREARRLLARASQSLNPGGTMLIFERGPIEAGKGRLPYSQIPMLLFFRSFRSPSLYEEHLKTLGFADVQVREIDLEMRFFLVTARLGA
jgi:SAM-dependent methyltransferase